MAAFKASLYFQLRSLFQYNNIYKLKSCQTRNSSKDQQCCTGWRDWIVPQNLLPLNKVGVPSGNKIGIDEEKSFAKAVHHAFRDRVQLLCTKHYNDNLAISQRQGRTWNQGTGIHTSCLLHICLWRDNYRRRSPFVRFQIEDLTRHLFTEFRIENRLKPLLEKRVNAPLQTSIIIKETMNNHPEKSLNWKPYKITDLIK